MMKRILPLLLAMLLAVTPAMAQENSLILTATVESVQTVALKAPASGELAPFTVRAGDMVCCSGSIIAGAPGSIYAQISRLAERKGAQCALDCNAKTLPESLQDARYALGKPNERELCTLLEAERTSEPHSVAELARRLIPPYDALVVSMGAQGGMWIGERRTLLARIPQLAVRSTVGSGDASFAGALHALSRGMEPEEILRLSMACGAANAVLGEVGSVCMEDVCALEKQIVITTIEE